MLLVLHIIIALSSIIAATAAMIHPSKRQLGVVYGLATTTLISGVLLMTIGVNILSLCVSGLAYLGIVLGMTAVVRHRLAVSI